MRKTQVKTIYSKYDLPLYLSGFSSNPGEKERSVDELSHFLKSDTLAFLKEMGVQNFRGSEQSTFELAVGAGKQTLEKSHFSAQDIDAVILVCESFSQENPASVNHNWMLEELDLEHCYYTGVYLRGCSNIHSALRIAANMCVTGEAETVLIITSDKAPSDPARIVPPSIGVTCDGAAAVILSKRPENADFRILCNAQCSIPAMHRLDESAQYMKFMKNVTMGVTAAYKRCEADYEEEFHTSKHIVTNNYSQSVINLFASIMGKDESIFITENISKFGHCFSSDNIFNLIHVLGQGLLNKGDSLFNLSSGPRSWGASVLIRE